jgi:hypothetical protein
MDVKDIVTIVLTSRSFHGGRHQRHVTQVLILQSDAATVLPDTEDTLLVICWGWYSLGDFAGGETRCVCRGHVT